MEKMIIDIVIAFATILTAIQLILMRKSENRAHEEVRRVKTLEVMENWHIQQTKEMVLCAKFAEKLNNDQLKELYGSKDFTIKSSQANAYQDMFPEETIERDTEEGTYKLSGKQIMKLRYNLIAYLNSLEIVFTSWKMNIVDSQVIEQEFKYLYNPAKSRDALKGFREAADGNDTYPNINEFIQTLENKSKEFSPSKKVL